MSAREEPPERRLQAKLPTPQKTKSSGDEIAGSTICFQAGTQGRGCLAVAQQAERPHVREIALPAAFRDRHSVIGVPERFPAALAKFPPLEKLPPRGEIQLAHVTP
jgi:hypothetical protein